MVNRIILLILIVVVTALVGEVNLKFPTFGDQFRFSLSPAVFFFALLWFRQMSALEIGMGVGLILPLFRTLVEMVSKGSGFWTVIPHHFPATVFYIVFAIFFFLLDLRRYIHNTWILVLLGLICDLFSNLGELGVRSVFGQFQGWDSRFLLVLLVFGVIRSIFVVGIFDIFSIQQLRILGDHQQQQIEKLMMINSSLYEEGFYLKKSMFQVEEITRESYKLYRKLRMLEGEHFLSPGLSTSALQIAEQIHELKKDTQRVLSGLHKLMNQEKLHGEVTFHELGQLVIHANEKYAEMLGKNIHFTYEASNVLKTGRVYALVSILNNLVSNSVEAIEYRGEINVSMALSHGYVEWQVKDTGPGIPHADADFVFEPGYTTKYDLRGNPSTGIGLSHCAEIATSLGGEVMLDRLEGTTVFHVRIPYDSLRDTQPYRQEEKVVGG